MSSSLKKTFNYLFNPAIQLTNVDIENYCRDNLFNVGIACTDNKCYLNSDEQERLAICAEQDEIDFCAVLYNTAKGSESEGEHWVALIKDNNGKKYFFDTYGRHPREFTKGFIKKIKPTHWNTRQYQHDDSNVCGQYCCFFLYCMSKRLSFLPNILNLKPTTKDAQGYLFDRIRLQNDAKIYNWWLRQNVSSKEDSDIEEVEI